MMSIVIIVLCMTDLMNLHYQQHGNESNDYTFILPETRTR